MSWRIIALPALVFLGAAAAPPGDCPPGLEAGQPPLAPLDTPARTNVPSGLTGPMFGALPATDVPAGCAGPLPSVPDPATLRSVSSEVLHGLPTPEILRRIDEPRRAPEFE